MKVLNDQNERVIQLPRGGYLVDTSAGYIQFGAPPETVKDTMLLPKGTPEIFVLPTEFFNWIKGISIAEMEFPIYYNFFLLKKKTLIICQSDQVEKFEAVIKESLFGPADINIKNDFYNPDESHDIESEMKYFRTMKFEDVVEFGIFKNDSFTINGITLRMGSEGGFEVIENGTVIANVPGKIEYKAKYNIGERLNDPFLPPLFGMTCLGPSSGFDPDENTSGFIIWINHIGVMIDPPVNSTEWLLDSNVSPKFIDSIILTHCHADHDAGTFQKILEENRITIYTTETIMKSFMDKYSGLTDVSDKYLMSLFDFRKVQIGRPVLIHGARFEMFYTLHSIPTIGFKMIFQNHSLSYSSDHNNDPDLHKKLLDSGVISQRRYADLRNFPWESTIVYHESGVPPLHTPMNILNSLPEEVKNKTVVYHIAKNDLPTDSVLTLAKFGMENTLYFNTTPPPFEKTYQIISMIRHLDFMYNISLQKVQEFVSIVDEEKYSKGEKIIRKGEYGDKFYIIYSGNVSIHSEDGRFKKIYGPSDYFGEAAIIKGEKRSADVTAETDVCLYSINKDKFLDFISGTDYEKVLTRLSEIRDVETWEVLSSSEFIKFFTSTQRNWLESMLTPIEIKSGGELIREGEPLESIYIIKDGKINVSSGGNYLETLKRGDIVGSVSDIYESKNSKFQFSHEPGISLYEIKKRDLILFLERNPGLVMKLRYDLR